tara:strand:+ start:1041 stop:1169 length:129 start_codon:yes stop_codon:yes gene_type:complete
MCYYEDKADVFIENQIKEKREVLNGSKYNKEKTIWKKKDVIN